MCGTKTITRTNFMMFNIKSTNLLGTKKIVKIVKCRRKLKHINLSMAQTHF
jgi:hypothetical protein